MNLSIHDVSATLPDWIQQPLTIEPLRAKSLLVTVLGDSVTPHGGRVWLGTLIALMEPFGVSERLVRTSVFRLVEEGWLLAQRSGRRSLYAMTPAGARRVAHAQRRIYEPEDANWDGSWTLLVVAAHLLDARTRSEIKRELSWEGYAALAPGLYGHPSNDLESIGELISTYVARGQITAFSARQEFVPVGGAGCAGLARSHWPLDTLAQRYRDFIVRYRDFARRGRTLDERAAFVARTLLVHAYRRVVLHDPHLPRELLPSDWPGFDAYALCQVAYTRLRTRSEAYFSLCCRAEGGLVAPAAPYFLERFTRPLANTAERRQRRA